MLKTVKMHAKHVVCIRTLYRAMQNGVVNTNPLIMNLSRLLRKNLGSFVRVSTVDAAVEAQVISYSNTEKAEYRF